MPRAINLVGHRYGALVVQALGMPYHPPKGRCARTWVCKCDCGNHTSVVGRNLRNGHTTSCGCRRVKHGEYVGSSLPSPELSSWRSMIARCSNPNSHAWSRYGGRGIRVCERWRASFAAFLDDMGRRPSLEHSIDRIDNDGDYEPSNCRWATRTEQALNRRNNRRIDAAGQSLTAPEWSRLTGIHKDTILGRIERGWDLNRAVTEAPQ
jgi:hypothetical protein